MIAEKKGTLKLTQTILKVHQDSSQPAVFALPVMCWMQVKQHRQDTGNELKLCNELSCVF